MRDSAAAEFDGRVEVILLLLIGCGMAVSGFGLGLGGRKIAQMEAKSGVVNRDVEEARRSDSAFDRLYGGLFLAQGDGIVQQWKVSMALGFVGCVLTVIALVGLAFS